MVVKNVGIVFLVFLSFSIGVYAEVSGEVSISIPIIEDLPNIDSYAPLLTLHVLDDQQDIGRRIGQLQEESKAILEPLIRRYMLTAEALTRLATHEISPEVKEEQLRLLSVFSAVKQDIESTLAHYRRRIDQTFEQHTVRRLAEMPIDSEALVIRDLSPGRYRVYGLMSFATTTLHWFEGVTIKGGDSYSIVLTRENIMNPYWTDLNWWKFMNLDFSKHHH